MVEDTTATAPEEAPEDAAEQPTTSRRWSVLPWLVAAVAVLVAAATTSAWLTLKAEADTRDDVRRAAEEFVVALTNWDASDGLEDTREELRAAGTGGFVAEVDELFGGSLGDELEEVSAVSVGEVEDVFVQRIQEDEAIALGVVVQELSTDLSDVPDRTVRSARLTLVREDDRWLVSAVELLADDVDAPVPTEAVPTEPASGGTPAPGATATPTTTEETAP